MRMIKNSVLLGVMLFLAGTVVLAGQGYAQTTGVVVVQPSQRVYTYPGGRYELRGDGTTISPYSWVWIPAGIQVVAPPPPPSVVQQPSQRVYAYAEGRYELRGDGTTNSPNYWVWIPAGIQTVPVPPPLPTIVQSASAPPPPPPILQPSQRVYTYPQGQYELRGDGTANSPYSWVWIPVGAVVATAGPQYRYLPDLKSTEGQVDSIDSWAKHMIVDGENFDFSDWTPRTNVPMVGEQIMVTYYVAQDGRNIVTSIDHSSTK